MKQFTFTIADACQRAHLTRQWDNRRGFTMAEILLSLTIIGVVAAITLPSLTGNINERTWNTQRKALYARFSQAIALMPSLNQYSTAETFVTNGLTKVLKINNICSNNFSDCGITSKPLTNLSGSTISMPATIADLNPLNTSVSFVDSSPAVPIRYSYSAANTNGTAFETANGESILAFYSPSCKSDMQENYYYAQEKICANFVYDLNGSKGPNAVGKDIGVITVIYPTDSIVVAPMPYSKNTGLSVAWQEGIKTCKALDSEYRMPNRYELMAMSYNATLFGGFQNVHYWSSARYSSTEAWYQSFTTGQMKFGDITSSGAKIVRCVKR